MTIKITWGVTVGLVAWVMISFAHLDGVRMLSNLGGLPALFLCLAVSLCAVRVTLAPAVFDTFKEGYDRAGRPLARRRLDGLSPSDGNRRADPEDGGNVVNKDAYSEN